MSGVGRARASIFQSGILAVLLGIGYLIQSHVAEGPRARGLTMHVGLILLAANVAGRIVSIWGLPRLTGYLLVGISMGPSFLGILSREVIADIQFIDRFALALIGLLAGGEIRFQRFKAAASAIGAITLLVTGIVCVGVTGTIILITPLLPFLSEIDPAGYLGIALLFGIWAANSSPDLTVAVVEEVGAEGPLTDVIVGVTILKDILVIVLFSVTLGFVESVLNPGPGVGGHVGAEAARGVGGAILIGAFLGWVFSRYLEAGHTPRSPVSVFLLSFVMVVIAEQFHLELLLMAVAAGFTIENVSAAGDRLIRAVRSVAVVVFALFFAIAGSSLDLGAIRGFWLAALIVFTARLILTAGGAILGSHLASAGRRIRSGTWKGLISQGGVSLSLLVLVERSIPEIGPGVVALGMAVVIGNILAGPVILKIALSQETPVTGSGSNQISGLAMSSPSDPSLHWSRHEWEQGSEPGGAGMIEGHIPNSGG